MRRKLIALMAVATTAASVLALAATPAAAVEIKGDGYVSWLDGNPSNAVVETTSGFMLEGGAEDLDAAWAWFLERAGYGDIVIICATCTSEYNPYVPTIHEVDSVQTLKITKRRATADPFVVGSVADADGIFFAGGDQSDYARIWKDTPVEDAVNDVIRRGGAVGGISAGLAISGEFAFAAEKNTITSDKALADCFDMKITLEREWVAIPALTSTITDSHFTERDRMGRLLTFMARTITDGWTTDVKGIGIDGLTAALLEPDGTATIVGEGGVSFLRMGADDVKSCEPRQALETGPIQVHVMHDGETFDISSWTGDPKPPLFVQAADGAITWTS